MSKKYTIKKMPMQKIFENAQHKRCFLALKEIVDKGERPRTTAVVKLAGLCKGLLVENRGGDKGWKKEMRQLIELKELEWQKHGGSEYIHITKMIDAIVSIGERPNIDLVCRNAEINHMYFSGKNNHYPFRARLLKRIKTEGTRYDVAKARENQRLQEEEIQKAIQAIPEGMELLSLNNNMTPKELYTLFFEGLPSIKNFQNVGLSLNEIRITSISLSHVLYIQRERTSTNERRYYVNPKSFDIGRKAIFLAIVQLAYDKRTSENTLGNELKSILDYLDYCDSLNTHPVPQTIEKAREGYHSFILHLRNKISLEDNFSTATSYRAQKKVQTYIKQLFSDANDQKNIFKGIKQIPKGTNENTTEVEDQDALIAITFYTQLFTKTCDLLFSPKTVFPCVITIDKKRYLCAPFGRKPLYQEGLQIGGTPFLYYDIDSSRLRKRDEISSPGFKDWTNKGQKLKKQHSKLIAVNADPNHPYRLLLAERAFQSFFLLFSALTGMKDSELGQLEWGEDDKLDVKKTAAKGIVTVKPRAHYKEMNYNLHRYGVTLLRKAAKLRRFLLQGYECKKFFFKGYGKNISTSMNLRTGHYGTEVIMRLQTINPDLPAIGSSKLRLFKSNQVMKQSNGNAWLASVMLGHSLSVNFKYYQGRDKKQRETEMYRFANAMVQTARNQVEQTSDNRCVNYKDPEFITKSDNLTCDNIFACFICKKYRVHADEDDIHKLLSLRYIIYRIGKTRAFSEEHFKTVLEPVSEMAMAYLKAMVIKYKCNVLINEIQTKVYHRAILHPYWEFKLTYLYDIGVL